jgi:hypothetical protein
VIETNAHRLAPDEAACLHDGRIVAAEFERWLRDRSAGKNSEEIAMIVCRLGRGEPRRHTIAVSRGVGGRTR